MDSELARSALVAFVTLFVVVDPLGVVPIFVALAADVPEHRRGPIVSRAVAIALAVALAFLVAGHVALAYLGVGIHAFTISGGVLLFMTAVPMLFGQRPALQSAGSMDSDRLGMDLAAFPLAVPLLSGPGTLTTILLLSTHAARRPADMVVLAACIVLVFALTWLILRLGAQVMSRLGADGVHVLTRVMGIILAALAVQYVLDGLRDWYRSLAA